ncbi:hypothetical protein MUP51_03125 [Candidatus Bathyarchaeota archaeon]|nr:hypothetical protein [Candidatus Bathyarchaeota archaeon]
MTIDKEGKKHMQRYVAKRIEEGIVHAQNYIDENQGELEMYAIAWDGYITSENERTDAVFVEAGDRNDSLGVTFCQRYREVREGLFKGKKCERIGNPALIDHPITRFK